LVRARALCLVCRVPGAQRVDRRAGGVEWRSAVHLPRRAGEAARPPARMSRAARLALFAGSGLVLAALLVWGLTGLPKFGDFQGEYGRILNSAAGSERHVTNVVAAVVFDYRGFDTLGEEFILFAAVMAVALLLREARSGEERRVDEARSDVVRAVGLFAVGPTVVLGL